MLFDKLMAGLPLLIRGCGELNPVDAVENGKKYLNRVKPGWQAEIDLLRFKLESLNDCIFGQLYGSYAAGVKALPLGMFGAVYCGFSNGNCIVGVLYPMKDLEVEWIRTIRELRDVPEGPSDS